ncbi:MAG: RHS repeat-associated core domain-containing protein [Gammaproteobacteria bacterium]
MSASGAYGNLSYSYDANGNRLSLTNGAASSNYVIAPTSNRLSQITGAGAKSFSYDAAGNTTASGPVSFTYNARGRMASTTQGTTTVGYSHNGRGERVKKTAASNSFFAYDEQGQLLGDYSGSGVALTETVYLGNLPLAVLTTKETLVDNATTANVTVVGTWPTATTLKGFHSTNYQTHAAGSGANTFAWKPTVTSAGSYRLYARWVAAASHATNATYTVTHSAGATPVTVNQQQNGGQWNLLGTFNFSSTAATITLSDQANGTVIADAVKLVSTANSSTIQYLYADQINTPRAITSTVNTVLWRWDSEPFGSTAPNQDADGNGVVFNYHLRFPGQYFDAETGLHYNYFRDYDAGTGRYVQSDPIGLRGGINTYGYVYSSPLRFTDAKGLIVYLCTRSAFGPPESAAGNHTYIWDDKKKRACGMEQFSGSGGNPLHPELGPGGGDSCVPVPNSDGQEENIIDCCIERNGAEPWIPFLNDCYSVATQCVDKYVPGPNPRPPGGRLKTDCDSCWKPKYHEPLSGWNRR